MLTRHIAGAMALACLALTVSGCSGVNAWVAGAENQVISDAASAANNVHTANVAAAQGWARSACALTLGGLAGASSSTITESAMKLCTPAGVTTGGVMVQTGNPAVGNPFALPSSVAAPVAPVSAVPPIAAPAASLAPAFAPAVARVKRPAVTQAVLTQSIVPPDPVFQIAATPGPIEPQPATLVPSSTAPQPVQSGEPTGGAIP
jgi:hypothetical protein